MENKKSALTAATATAGREITTTYEALNLITQYAVFEVKYIDDEKFAKEYFQGRMATLDYNLETETYTLVSDVRNIEKAIIWAAGEIIKRHRGGTCKI